MSDRRCRQEEGPGDLLGCQAADHPSARGARASRESSGCIYYAGTLVDPHSVEDDSWVYPLPAISSNDGDPFEVSLEIVEWRMPSERRMYFCDGSGFPLDDATPGIQSSRLQLHGLPKIRLLRQARGGKSLGNS